MAQAVQSAAAGPQEPVFFYRPLSPSVVGGAPLSLVTWFVLQHMPEKAKWHLQLDGSTTEWPVTFCRDEGVGKRAFRGQLSGGWPRFAKENDLKATDWLKFTLIGPRKLRVMRLAGKPADWKPPHDSHSEKAGSKRPLTLTSPENGRGKPPGQALKRQKVAAPEAAAPNGLPVQAPDEQQRAAAPAGIAAARTTRDPRRQPLATMPVPRKPGSSAADASASASADQALRTAQQEAQEARQAAERARLQEKMQRKARSLNRPSLQPGKGSRTALTSDLHASPTPSASLGRLNSQSPSSAQGVMAQDSQWEGMLGLSQV
ncbi:hypothetical protein WJX72_007736 [[Myrmecia] bisecta]|uniref:TF-B3 domain-containing protein n=1 Tax=[Myrmecia] bisecta TaxID=41462 RepID=A0AAW1PHJ1_9CHLO